MSEVKGTEVTTGGSAGKRWLIAAAVVAALVGVGVFYSEWLKPRLFPKRFGVVVEDSLFRSGRIHEAVLHDVFVDHGIDRVVTLTHGDGRPWQVLEQETADSVGAVVERFGLNGNGTGRPEMYVGAIKAISTAVANGEQVLVHCAAGTQRTGGVVLLYRTLVRGDPVDEAFADMRSYEFDPDDNPDLLPWLNEHRAYIEGELAAAGLLNANVDRAGLTKLLEGTGSD